VIVLPSAESIVDEDVINSAEDGSYPKARGEQERRVLGRRSTRALPAGRTVSEALEAQRIKLAELAATEVGILQRHKPSHNTELEPMRQSAAIQRYLDQINTLKKPNNTGCFQARMDIQWVRYIFYAGFQMGE
jgi:hypothetical protein